MNRITFPLNQEMTSPEVADLQDALRLLINQRVLLANDQTAARELAGLLIQERATQTFGRATGELVSNFQREQSLQASGEVDEVTANVLNTLLKRLDPFDPATRPHIVSGAVRREDGLPLQGVQVRAAHEAGQRSVRLGEDITDTKGRYTIRYELLPELGGINLRVSATSKDGKLLQSSDLVQNAKPLETIDLITPMAEKPAAEQRIEGAIVLEHGVPAGNLKLRLYRRDFGGETTLLDETSTLEGGQYAFTYDPEDKALSLEVRAVNEADEEITLSEPLNYLSREPRAVLNLIAPATLQPLAAEYGRLSADLTPHLGEMTQLAEAKENDEQQDLTVLNRATGWDARLIALAATTERLSADPEVNLPQEAVYGLLRAGLPSDKLLLAQVGPDVAELALKTVRDEGIVELTDAQIEAFKTAFTTFSETVRLNIPAPGSTATYGDLLETSDLSPDAQATFVPIYLNHRGDADQLWEKAQEAGLDDGEIRTLQLQGKFAFLAGNSKEMTEHLLQEIEDPVQLVEGGFHRPDQWKTEITALADTDGQELGELIPAAYAAEDVEDRLNAYAEDMARKVRLSYPTQVVAQLIEDDDTFKPLDANDTTSELLKMVAGQGFRLGETPVAAFLEAHEEIFDGSSDAEARAGRQQLQKLQRVYQITPGNEAMPVLMNLGMSSALDVTAYPESEFTELYIAAYLDLHGKPPPEAEPRLVYSKAEQVSSVTYNLFTIARKMGSEPPVAVLSAPVDVREDEDVREEVRNELIKHFPTMQTLFGSLDFCECEHCRSVLSPAAYLVDLLQFVDPEPGVWVNFLARWKATHGDEDYPHQDADGNAMKPYDVLIERRPDLPHIPLTCENTHTALPYIDVVNEILEYYVAHGKLEEDAAHDTGDATTAELLAEPQHVIRAAYDKLDAARYPLNLPFDLWIETVRQFCNFFETPLDQILETFRPSDELFAPAQPFDRASIFMESLGLSPTEAALFTDPDPLANWHELYGFSDAAEATTEATDATGQRIDLNSAKALSWRLGVTYKEIAEIVQTGFVNPGLTELHLLYKLGVSIRDARFYLDHKALLGQDPATLSREDQERQLEVEAFSNALDEHAERFEMTVEELEAELQAIPFDEILVLADPDAGCNFDRTVLQHADGTTAAEESDFLRINLFVRLWRKLGWSIEETDRALSAFIPRSVPFDEDSDHLAQQPLKTALIYLAHLKTLDEKVQVGKQSLLKLLALWSDIATSGTKPLYAQLFLTRSVLENAPVFDDPRGDYLSDASIKLKDHALALQGAMGLTAEEIRRILKDNDTSLEDAELSLPNVSLLYRYGLLARALKRPVRELIALKQLSGLNPFEPLHPDPLETIDEDHPFSRTLRFVEIHEELKASGLKIEALDYLLRHRFDETGTYRPDDEETHALVKTLAEGVAAIRAEHAIPTDPRSLSDEVLRQKLGLALPADIAERFLAMMNGTAELTPQEVRAFFEKYLLKQAIRPEYGFLDESDFDLLFDPARLREQRQRLAETFLPYLQQRLIRQFIVQTMTAHTGADPALVESLVTDERLLAVADSEPLLTALAATGERGVSAAFFDSDELPDPPPALTSVVRSADTIFNTGADANSARFEGYLEVPTPGAYRFFIELDNQNAKAELRFDHLPDPVFLKDVAAADNTTLGDLPDEFVELKPSVPYSFSLDLEKLDGGGARLLVQGETLPGEEVSQLTLYPLSAVVGAENALLLLTKALQLVQSLGLSEREIRYLLTHAADFDEVDLSDLPTQPVGDTPAEKEAATNRFNQVLRLAAYARLKRDLTGGTDDLVGIFEANGTADLNNVYPLIASLTRRDETTVEATAEALVAAPMTPAFESEKPLWRLWEALQIVERFGVPVASLLAWTRIVRPATTPEQREQRFGIARDLREAVKARFEPEGWQRVAQSIFDTLRQRQRDALVSHVMHQHGFDRLEQLYEYFLIDPGMEPVVQTSRIRLAIASLQLFIQRCLLNLEVKVNPSTINSKHWEWMKRYRVWEANRKIFLFPENWLEPEFRDDKTHLFQELEDALLQDDVSGDLAEDAFLGYLKKLDELARLDIVAMHIEDDPDTARRTLHVFGRTYSRPHKYFYRRFAHQMWTPWEPVDAEIEGDHLAPVVWRDRLYLFWVTFMEKPEQTEGDTTIQAEPDEGVTIEAVKNNIDVQLHWSEYLQGEWSTGESGDFMPVMVPSWLPPHWERPKVGDTRPVSSNGLVWVEATEIPVPLRTPLSFDLKSVFIHVSQEPYDSGEFGVKIHLKCHHKFQFSFHLTGRNSTPEMTIFVSGAENPYSTNQVRATRYSGSGPLKVTFRQRISTDQGEARTIETPSILQQGARHNVVPCDNKLTLGVSEDAFQDAVDPDAVEAAIEKSRAEIASLISPVFYQDSRHTLFVEPEVTERTIEEWQEWVTQTPRPEPTWQKPDWWKDLVVIPEKPRKRPHLDPRDPRLVFEIAPGSLIKPSPDRDWLVNPATVLEFDNVLISAAGQPGLHIAAGEVADAVAAGGLSSGGAVFFSDATSLEQSGLIQTAGGLNVVGNTGFNSVLAQNLKETNPSSFGGAMPGAGRIKH